MTLIHLGPPVVFNRKEVVTLRKSKMPHDVQVCKLGVPTFKKNSSDLAG